MCPTISNVAGGGQAAGPFPTAGFVMVAHQIGGLIPLPARADCKLLPTLAGVDDE